MPLSLIGSGRYCSSMVSACRGKPENPYMEWTRFETNYMTDA
jgi:hypothetical protein